MVCGVLCVVCMVGTVGPDSPTSKLRGLRRSNRAPAGDGLQLPSLNPPTDREMIYMAMQARQLGTTVKEDFETSKGVPFLN